MAMVEIYMRYIMQDGPGSTWVACNVQLDTSTFKSVGAYVQREVLDRAVGHHLIGGHLS